MRPPSCGNSFLGRRSPRTPKATASVAAAPLGPPVPRGPLPAPPLPGGCQGGAHLRGVDARRGLPEPLEGLARLLRDGPRISDEGEGLEPPDHVGRELRVEVPVPEVVVGGSVLHPEDLDEGVEDEPAVRREGVEGVPPADLLLQEREEHLHPREEPCEAYLELLDEPLGVEGRGLRDARLVEGYDGGAVDPRLEVLVRGGSLEDGGVHYGGGPRGLR